MIVWRLSIKDRGEIEGGERLGGADARHHRCVPANCAKSYAETSQDSRVNEYA